MNIVKQHKEVIIGVVISLVVGLSLGYGWGRQTSGAGMMMTTETPATTTQPSKGIVLSGTKPANPTVAAIGNSVSVPDQAAGMSVKLGSVMLSQEAWVAVRDQNGVTLGAALFAPGSHTGVSVPLLKPTQAGSNYQALIYFDDGSKTFSLKTETIVLEPDGSVAGTSFTAQ